MLFAGPYAPQAATPGGTTLVQNYTVTIPSDFPSGPALLSVPHFVLVGVCTCVHNFRWTGLTRSVVGLGTVLPVPRRPERDDLHPVDADDDAYVVREDWLEA